MQATPYEGNRPGHAQRTPSLCIHNAPGAAIKATNPILSKRDIPALRAFWPYRCHGTLYPLHARGKSIRVPRKAAGALQHSTGMVMFPCTGALARVAMARVTVENRG